MNASLKKEEEQQACFVSVKMCSKNRNLKCMQIFTVVAS